MKVPFISATYDIEGGTLFISGEYNAPDLSCGYSGSFSIDKVWVGTDPNATDIHELLSEVMIDRLEDHAFRYNLEK